MDEHNKFANHWTVLSIEKRIQMELSLNREEKDVEENLSKAIPAAINREAG